MKVIIGFIFRAVQFLLVAVVFSASAQAVNVSNSSQDNKDPSVMNELVRVEYLHGDARESDKYKLCEKEINSEFQQLLSEKFRNNVDTLVIYKEVSPNYASEFITSCSYNSYKVYSSAWLSYKARTNQIGEREMDIVTLDEFMDRSETQRSKMREAAIQKYANSSDKKIVPDTEYIDRWVKSSGIWGGVGKKTYYFFQVERTKAAAKPTAVTVKKEVVKESSPSKTYSAPSPLQLTTNKPSDADIAAAKAKEANAKALRKQEEERIKAAQKKSEQAEKDKKKADEDKSRLACAAAGARDMCSCRRFYPELKGGSCSK